MKQSCSNHHEMISADITLCQILVVCLILEMLYNLVFHFRHVMKELIDTERVYVDELRSILEVIPLNNLFV